MILSRRTILFAVFLSLSGGAFALGDEDGIAECGTALDRLPEMAALQRYFNAIANSGQTCAYVTQSSCQGTQVDTRWYLRAVDGDLMQKEMDQWRALGRSKGPEPVAVVDGYFGQHTGDNLVMPPASLTQVSQDAYDKAGHGALVAQLIGGKDGAGLSPQSPLHLYDVGLDPREAGGSSLDSLAIATAMQTACAAGTRVLNASFNVSKKDDTSPFLHDLSNWLADRGCVMVKAAGNDGVQEGPLLSKFSADFSAYLNVGATRHSGGISNFSDAGSVYAPGQGISVKLPSDYGDEACGDRSEAVESGTSIAAPITSAITAQVTEVLDSSPAFQSLPKRSQADLIIKIVAGSSDSSTGDVNGLKAVRRAMAWAGKQAGQPASFPCRALPDDCVAAPTSVNCGNEDRCSQAVREILDTCPDSLASQPLDLFLRLQTADPWLALRMVDSFTKDGKNQAWKALISRLYGPSYWENEIRKQAPPFNNLENLMDVYARTRRPAVDTAGVPEQKIATLLVQAGAGDLHVRKILSSLWDDDVMGPALLRQAKEQLVTKPSKATSGENAVNILNSLYRKGPENLKANRLVFDYVSSYKGDPAVLPNLVRGVVFGGRPFDDVSGLLEQVWSRSSEFSSSTKIEMGQLLQRALSEGRIEQSDYDNLSSVL